jgi:ferritin-like protein
VASEGLHEPEDRLSAATIERHRAVVSLVEELQAIDWYDQRVDATRDPALAGILRHNRDEEKEHAAMTLEWLRRADPVLDRFLRQYLFSDGPIADPADAAPPRPGDDVDVALGIGSLRELR